MAHHVIYIPGLGDNKTYGQNIGIQLWRIAGLTPHYFTLGWSKKEGLDSKLGRLEKKVNELLAEGDRVSLVGVSAGASAALRVYDKIPEISKVVLIVGKVNSPESIHPVRYARNPDFKESVYGLDKILGRLKQKKLIKNILSLRSLRDNSVPRPDSFIEGAGNSNIVAWNHSSAILVSVLFYFPIIARFIKS